MRVYVVCSAGSETLGAEFSKQKAIALLRSYGQPGSVLRVTMTTHSTREIIRRLIGDVGGYADESETVFTIEE